MNGKKARALRREQQVKQFEEDSKLIYLANRAVPGQVFAADVTWRIDERMHIAECLAGSSPITVAGRTRYEAYFRAVERLVYDLNQRGVPVAHVPADFIRQFGGRVEDAREVAHATPASHAETVT